MSNVASEGVAMWASVLEHGAAESGSTAPAAAEGVMATVVSRATSADADAWNTFVEQHPLGTVDHLWEWQHVFEDVFGHRSAYLVARQGEALTGVLPLVIFASRLFGRQIVSMPMLNYGGLLVDDAGAVRPLLAAAEDVARSVRARHVELRHRAPTTSLPARRHKVSMRLALPPSADALWSGLDRKVRNLVRKAQKSALDVTFGGAELVEAFYPVFAEHMRDLGTPVYPRRLFAQVCARLPTRTVLCVVSYRGAPVAAAVTLRFKDTVLVPWASALRRHRQLSPNMLLYWAMIERAIADGARVFDFGRSSPDAGTYQFKAQWGATPEPQCWEYVLLTEGPIPDQGPGNGRFGLAIEAWKRLPLWLANRAGPLLVRNIP